MSTGISALEQRSGRVGKHSRYFPIHGFFWHVHIEKPPYYPFLGRVGTLSIFARSKYSNIGNYLESFPTLPEPSLKGGSK